MAYDPSEERDDHGRWTGGGGGRLTGPALTSYMQRKFRAGDAAEHAAATSADVGAGGSSSLSYPLPIAPDEGSAGPRELPPGEFGNNPRFAPEPRNPITDESVNEQGRQAQAASEARSSIRDEIEARREANIERVRARADGTAQTHSDATSADTSAAGSVRRSPRPGVSAEVFDIERRAGQR